MTLDNITAALLIAVPVSFNVAFFALGRAFDYPNILRKEPDEILRRFAAGGAGVILRWEALLLSAPSGVGKPHNARTHSSVVYLSSEPRAASSAG